MAVKLAASDLHLAEVRVRVPEVVADRIVLVAAAPESLHYEYYGT